MKLASVIQRLEAWRRGAPIALGETLPWPRSATSDRLVLAFVRMAGEARPWGFAAGPPGSDPTIVTIPEPRDAAESARLAAALATHLLPHLPHPRQASESERTDVASLAGRRQLWVPGATHLEMLHFLDYRFSGTTRRDDPATRDLPALGRAAGWLFRESRRPGQVRVFDATARIRDAFAVPAEDVRQEHLGFLLAWITGPGGRDERIEAARRAEDQTVGITLSPSFERDVLDPLLHRWNQAKTEPSPEADADAASTAAAIHAALAPELLRRFRLVEAAIAALEESGRAPNPGLDDVLALAAEEFTWQYWNTEVEASVPITDPDTPRFYGANPETDFLPTQAAARFFAHLHAAEVSVAALVHGDRHLVAEAIDGGDAIRGTIARVVNEGTKRSTIPVWTVVAPVRGPLRLREESTVCVVGLRGRTGRIRSISTEGATRTITIEIDNWKRARPDEGAPAADARELEGTEVTLVDAGVVGLSKRKSIRVWDASGPGAWLTHAAPPPEPSAHPPVDCDLVALVEKLGAG